MKIEVLSTIILKRGKKYELRTSRTQTLRPMVRHLGPPIYRHLGPFENSNRPTFIYLGPPIYRQLGPFENSNRSAVIYLGPPIYRQLGPFEKKSNQPAVIYISDHQFTDNSDHLKIILGPIENTYRTAVIFLRQIYRKLGTLSLSLSLN